MEQCKCSGLRRRPCNRCIVRMDQLLIPKMVSVSLLPSMALLRFSDATSFQKKQLSTS